MKAAALLNVAKSVVTDAVFQPPISPLNVIFCEKSKAMFETAATFHSPIGPLAVLAAAGSDTHAITAERMFVSVMTAEVRVGASVGDPVQRSQAQEGRGAPWRGMCTAAHRAVPGTNTATRAGERI